MRRRPPKPASAFALIDAGVRGAPATGTHGDAAVLTNRSERCKLRVVGPRIQYARTSDRVSIAYWAIGDGPPLLHLPWGTLSHCQGEWRLEGCRRWYERLALRSTVIRYDPRGCGRSDPMGGSLSVDDLVKDIEAIVALLGLKQLALLAAGESGNTAIAYAAKHTDPVSRIVLGWSASAGEQARALAASIRGVDPVSLRLLLDTFHSFDALRLLPM